MECGTGRRGYRQAVRALPPRLRTEALSLEEGEQGRVEEVRLRTGWPMSAVFPQVERELGGEPVSGEELEQLLEIASQASVHTALPQLRQGYLTLGGGGRLGP